MNRNQAQFQRLSPGVYQGANGQVMRPRGGQMPSQMPQPQGPSPMLQRPQMPQGGGWEGFVTQPFNPRGGMGDLNQITQWAQANGWNGQPNDPGFNPGAMAQGAWQGPNGMPARDGLKQGAPGQAYAAARNAMYPQKVGAPLPKPAQPQGLLSQPPQV